MVTPKLAWPNKKAVGIQATNGLSRMLKRWDSAYKWLSDESRISPLLAKVCLGTILLSCLAIRLWTIGAPALDRTTWKEIDYIAISSNYWNHGFNFFHPEISWPADPPRYTAMEFPLVPYMAAVLYEIFGYNAYTVRLITLLAFLLMSVYVYRLGKREFGPLIGLSAGLASAIIPLYHSFGRYLFSEPLMIAMSVVAIFHFAEWIDHGRRRDWILSWLGLTLAIALKLEPLYLFLPLLWLAFRIYGLELKRYRGFVTLVVCSLLLPLMWYSYAYYLSSTSIDVFGVFGGLNGAEAHNKFQTLTMLTDPAWYKTMFNRISVGILGGKVGSLLFLLGLFGAVRSKKGGVVSAYLLAVLCYFGLVAEGQIDAPYRQLTIVPPLAVFVALGTVSVLAIVVAGIELIGAARLTPRIPAWVLLFCCAAILGLVPIRKAGQVLYRDPDVPMSRDAWELAQEIAKRAEPGAKLVVFGEYSIHVGGNDLSPVLYYYARRQGWTLRRDEWNLSRVHALREQGATFFAARNVAREPEAAPFLRELRSHYQVVYEGPGQMLVDLRTSSSLQ